MMPVAIKFVTTDKARLTNCVKLITEDNEGMMTPICVNATALRPMASNAVTYASVLEHGF